MARNTGDLHNTILAVQAVWARGEYHGHRTLPPVGSPRGVRCGSFVVCRFCRYHIRCISIPKPLVCPLVSSEFCVNYLPIRVSRRNTEVCGSGHTWPPAASPDVNHIPGTESPGSYRFFIYLHPAKIAKFDGANPMSNSHTCLERRSAGGRAG